MKWLRNMVLKRLRVWQKKNNSKTTAENKRFRFFHLNYEKILFDYGNN